jgi:hypothetical protein
MPDIVPTVGSTESDYFVAEGQQERAFAHAQKHDSGGLS